MLFTGAGREHGDGSISNGWALRLLLPAAKIMKELVAAGVLAFKR